MDVFRRAAAEFVGTFAVIFVGAGVSPLVMWEHNSAIDAHAQPAGSDPISFGA